MATADVRIPSASEDVTGDVDASVELFVHPRWNLYKR